ncbi:MAG: AtpZ/AtpI family protein [Deltaproteobacteria bacterium]|jgi:ATP synthase protein I|nr:AtpZ/AtpI family protein [Deltaproteobacteria bacterium]
MDSFPPGTPDELPKNQKKKRIGISEVKMLAQASSIGIAMVLSVFFGLAAGYWLDGRFGTRPLFILIGLLAGVAAAFNNLIVLSRRMELQRKRFYGADGRSGLESPGGPPPPERLPADGASLAAGRARASRGTRVAGGASEGEMPLTASSASGELAITDEHSDGLDDVSEFGPVEGFGKGHDVGTGDGLDEDFWHDIADPETLDDLLGGGAGKGPDAGEGIGPDAGEGKGPDAGEGKGPDEIGGKGPDEGAGDASGV